MRKSLLFISILLMSLNINGYAGTTSYDNVFSNSDIFASDFASRLNANFTRSLTGGINAITSTNVTDASLKEVDMADEINPRVRTYEGAACEFVYTGLLPVSGASLTQNIASGTAYPRGYRINKASATSHTYTASKWTWVDLDINGNFQYSEQAIGSATPSVASNSIRLARVSTDSSTVLSVLDMRKTSCTNGPFSAIVDTTGEATLDDVFKNGSPVRKFSPNLAAPNGFAQGAFVSWDTTTTFKVTSGTLYINGKYRSVSTDTTVPVTAAAPLTGTSGLDTGSVTGGPKTYYVYGVADQDSVKTYSVVFSTSSTAPTGVTNYRLIGSIRTDSANLFTSTDVVTVHGISPRELIGASISFDGSATSLTMLDGINVASLTDNGTGDYTITFDGAFNGANYMFSCSAYGAYGGSDYPLLCGITATANKTKTSIRVSTVRSDTLANSDAKHFTIIISGDQRR